MSASATAPAPAPPAEMKEALGPIVLVVTGSRGITSYDLVAPALEKRLAESGARVAYLFHGACPDSPDLVADEWARRRTRATILDVPAPWDEMGGSAGPWRNGAMLDAAHALATARRLPLVVAAFWNDHSSGTADCMIRARCRGITVWSCFQKKNG